MYFYIIVFAICLISVEVSLGYGLTFTRIGVLLLITANVIFRRKVRLISFILTIPLFLLTMYGIIISFIMGVKDGTLYRALAWLLYALIIQLIINLFMQLNLKKLKQINFVVLIACIFYALYSIYLLSSSLGINFYLSPPYKVRNIVNEVPGGLSSYFLGVLSLAYIGLMSSYISNSKRINKCFIIVCIIVILITLSRQFLIYSLVSLLIYYTLSLSTKFSFKLSLKSGLVILLGIISAVKIFKSEVFLKYVDRIINIEESYSTNNQSTSTRASLIENGLDLFKSFPFGYGPNAHDGLLDRPPHNSYISLAIDYGVVGLFLHLSFGLLLLFQVRKTSENLKIFMSLFIPLYFLSPLFNDVTTIPVYWATIAVLFSLAMNNNPTLNLSIKKYA